MSSSSRGLSSSRKRRKAKDDDDNEKDTVQVVKKVKSQSQKNTKYKLHIGWLNFQNGRHRQVTGKYGGGTREHYYEKDVPLTAEAISELAKKMFFPQGKSHFGFLSEMDACLSNFKGDAVTAFYDIDGNECSLQTHLKSNGMFSSQFYIYLKTTTNSIKTTTSEIVSSEAGSKSNASATGEGIWSTGVSVSNTAADEIGSSKGASVSSEKKKKFRINGKTPGQISIRYRKEKQSAYDSSRSYLTCHSMRGCYETSSGDIQFEEYNPFCDGFGMTFLSIGKQILVNDLDTNIDASNMYSLSDDSVLYTPHDVNGYEASGGEDEYIVLGVVIKNFPDSVTIYWYRNGQMISVGQDLYAIMVSQPGLYSFAIQTESEGPLHKCDPPVNVTLDISETKLVQECQTDANSLPNMDYLSTFNSQKETNTSLPTTFTNTRLSQTDSNTSLPMSEAAIAIPHTQKDTEIPISQSYTSLSHTQSYTIYNGTIMTPTNTKMHQKQPYSGLPMTVTHTDLPLTRTSLLTSDTKTNLPIIKTNNSQPMTQPNLALTQNNDYLPVTQTNLPLTQTNMTATETATLLPIIQTNTCLSMSQTNNNMPMAQTQTSMSMVQTHSQNKKITCGVKTSEEPSIETTVALIHIDDVIIEGKIGEGSFGEVYKGSWIGTDVAIKKIKVKRMKYRKKLLLREIDVHGRIRHPNIVLIMGFAMSNDHLFLITEHIDGLNLDEVLFSEAGRKLDFFKRVLISLKIAQALAYLHNQKPAIIHRDIKPENVLISENADIVKLCDMGLSKLNTLNSTVTTFANECELQPGTPAYQAPEILLKHSPACETTDVWSLSCTISEVFSEEPAWPSDCSVEEIHKLMREKTPPCSLQQMIEDKAIPPVVVNHVIRGLQYRPEERPMAIHFISVLKSALDY